MKPSIPRGTRDFLPAEMARRNFIFSTIRNAFERFGFLPIETPAMENLSTLTGKYGDEGDKLIFKILNSGNFLDKASETALKSKDSAGIIPSISEKALRYDLTVPFARFVVQHRNDISFPFKRYQIQPVWRADRPQRGRYREFFQCDADVVGSSSLLYEVELVQLFDEALSNLGLKEFVIRINNRKILSGIAEVTGMADKLTDMTVAIDKLDKIGREGVISELQEKGFSPAAIDQINPLFSLPEDNREALVKMEEFLAGSATGLKGIEEVRYILDLVQELELKNASLKVDITLARGLNYYTGAIFEVNSTRVSIGSICGGGRYDDLTGIFGLPDVSGVGISFGADRIYDVMKELDLFPKELEQITQILFFNMGETETRWCLKALKSLRSAGISAEIYPEKVKLNKQFKYADDKSIPYVAIVGEKEMDEKIINLKHLASGNQEKLPLEELIRKFNP